MNEQERTDATRYALGEGIWGIGVGLIAPLTVLPLLIRMLGGGNIEVGIVYSLATAGVVVTQPIGMLLFRQGAGKKNFMLVYHCLTVLPATAAIGAIVYFFAPREATHGMGRALILAAYSLEVLMIGVIVPPWADWVAGLFSTQSRGRGVGMYAAFSALGVSLGALVAAKIRGAMGSALSNYALLYVTAVCLFGASLGMFSRVSSGQPRPEADRRPTLRDLLARFAHSLGETNYRSYLVGRVLLTMGAGATGFFAVQFHSPQGGGLSDVTIIGLGAFLTLPQALASYWLGVIGDRSGHRAGILIGGVAQIAAIAIASAGRGALACALCFVFQGIAFAATWVSHQNMIFETCPHDNRIAHITLSNLVMSPFMLALPVATGWLVSSAGAPTGIGLCVAPSVLGTLWLLFMVRDPRHVVLEV